MEGDGSHKRDAKSREGAFLTSYPIAVKLGTVIMCTSAITIELCSVIACAHEMVFNINWGKKVSK